MSRALDEEQVLDNLETREEALHMVHTTTTKKSSIVKPPVDAENTDHSKRSDFPQHFFFV